MPPKVLIFVQNGDPCSCYTHSFAIDKLQACDRFLKRTCAHVLLKLISATIGLCRPHIGPGRIPNLAKIQSTRTIFRNFLCIFSYSYKGSSNLRSK